MPSEQYQIYFLKRQTVVSDNLARSNPNLYLPNKIEKAETTLAPPPARILGGQNTEEKTPFPFWKENRVRTNQESKERFSSVSAEALRGGVAGYPSVRFSFKLPQTPSVRLGMLVNFC